jgi:DNA-binding transcriptional MerR regulator
MLNKDQHFFTLSSDEIKILTESQFTGEFPNLMDEVDLPKYTISDLKIAPRDATYWDQQGILPVVKGPGMRRKYDLIQSVWIKLIQQMRSLGISLNKIKRLKEILLEPKIDLNLLNPNSLNEIISEIKVKYNSRLSSEQLLKELEGNRPTIFISMVLATIIFRKSFQCMVNTDGEYFLYEHSRYPELFSNEEEFRKLVSKPHFCISISEAIQSLMRDWVPDEPFEELYFLSNTEKEILAMIRRNDVNSIRIRFSEGAPHLLEVEEQSKITMEQRFLDVIAKNGYQKISVTTQKGKITNFENVILKKLNNSTK